MSGRDDLHDDPTGPEPSGALHPSGRIERVDQPVELSWPDKRRRPYVPVRPPGRKTVPVSEVAQPSAPEPPAAEASAGAATTVADGGAAAPPDRTPPDPAAGERTGETPAQATSRTSRLLSATVLMMGGTIVSRVLGLARVVLAAYLLGNNSRQAEIWSLATTVPNSLYILFAGGALNTVLVPQIVRAVKNDPDGGEAYTNRIMTAFLLLVGVMAVVLVIASPVVAWVYSDAAWHTPELAPQFGSMVLLTALCLPQVFFYGAFFLFGQVLNARERFGPMMWAPIANNLVAVAVLLLYALVWGWHGDTSQPFTVPQALLLGLGSVLGIATQTAVLIPFMRRSGFRYRPRFDLRRTGLGHTFHVAKWTLGFVAVNQLALLVVTRLGTSATAGGVGAGMAAYNNANLLWVLPHSLITVSLATAILPAMSRHAAADDPRGVGRELERAIRLTTTALVPVSLLFLVIGVPIATLAFRGETKGGDLVGWTLTAFALGLIPFTVQYLLLRGFYAFEDTRSTFHLQCLIAACNAGLAILFVSFVNPGPRWVAPALALSYTLAYAVGLAVSAGWFRNHVPSLDLAGLGRHVLLVAAAALPGSLLAFGLVTLQRDWSRSLGADLLGIGGGGLLAILVYVVMARVLGVAEVGEVIGLVLRRGRGKETEVAEPTDRPAGEPTTPAGQPVRPDTAMLPTLDGGYADPPDDSLDPAAADDVAGDGALFASPGADLVGESEEPADLEAAPQLPVGLVLGGRFRLEEEMAIRGSTVTWRASDQRLSRSVLVHVLAASDPDTGAIVAAAKRAAQTTDARFLRVLDAVDEHAAADVDDPAVPYIVCEWADGLNLRHVLAGGPLTALESAWLVHQLADALAGTHAQGLYHGRLNPDTILVTATGNVKAVGFLIEAALHNRALREAGEPPVRAERQESEDVLGLGRLLYAALVSRWPGGPAYGLPGAPITATGSWQTPGQVRAGASPALDRIADRILNPEPRSGEPLRTASRIALELGSVLGSVDASHDLERRVRYLMANPSGTVLDELPDADDSLFEEPTPAQVVSHVTAVPPPQSPPLSALTPTDDVPRARPGSRRPPWVLVLVLAVAVALVGGLVATAVRGAFAPGSGAASGAQSASPASQAPATPYAIAGVADFDPTADKGNGEENPGQVGRAHDGDPQTSWNTLTYRGNPRLGGLKPGVGLVIDLGREVAVSEVRLQLTGTGTDVELRVPKADAAAAVTTAPYTTAQDWTAVAAENGAGATATLKPADPVTTRYLLVYLTRLPAVSGGYQAGVAEVEVLS